MARNHIKAKKSLGQNFLVNPGVLEKIVQAAQLTPTDTVLEVGPGTGNLTEYLAKTGARIIAVEKDRRLIEPLKEKFTNQKNIEIVEGDILEFDVLRFKFQDSSFKVVANIPYYITSHFLRTIFEQWPRPKLIVLTIQKEVARRICARPPEMNLLALSVQLYAEPEIIADVSAGSFRPIPKVDSSIIRLTPKDASGIDETARRVLALAKLGFAGKRKQLLPALARQLGVERAVVTDIFNRNKILVNARAQNLTLSQWNALAAQLSGPDESSR